MKNSGGPPKAIDIRSTAPAAVAASAQRKLAVSAGKLTESAEQQEDSADRRTELAADRTLLAGERTYAAWVRTGLSAMAFGIGAAALLDGLVAKWLILTTSLALVVFAQFCFIAAVWRQLERGVPPPRPDVRRLPGWLLIVFNGFLIVVAGAVLVGIWTH